MLVIGTVVKIKTDSTIVICDTVIVMAFAAVSALFIDTFGICFVAVIVCIIAAFVVIFAKISVGAKNTPQQLITFAQVGTFSIHTCFSGLVTFVVGKVAAFVIVCACSTFIFGDSVCKVAFTFKTSNNVVTCRVICITHVAFLAKFIDINAFNGRTSLRCFHSYFSTHISRLCRIA